MTDFFDHTRLIINEELSANSDGTEQQEKREIGVIEEEDVTHSKQFSPVDTDNRPELETFPIYGTGELDTLAVRGNSPDYKIDVSVDETDIVDTKSYSKLDAISTDLSRISAYKSAQGTYVVALTGYPFNDILRVSIIPDNKMTFKLVRAELIMDEVKDDTNEVPAP